jgi:hypothetical protein
MPREHIVRKYLLRPGSEGADLCFSMPKAQGSVPSHDNDNDKNVYYK